jgi:hypothetical protein
LSRFESLYYSGQAREGKGPGGKIVRFLFLDQLKCHTICCFLNLM